MFAPDSPCRRDRDTLAVARNRARTHVSLGMSVCVTVGGVFAGGCKDGPLYALKAANPYFAMREWKRDEALGVTDHERRKQLTTLAEQIGDMSADKQAFWAVHLKKIMENDPSPEMRRLAIVAAGRLRGDAALPLIEQGLDDDSLKVRLFACESLGQRSGDEAARLLAATAGTSTDQDVRHAALSALANHSGSIPVGSLRLALNDRNPATRDLAMRSLSRVTGQNLPADPDVWIAALDKPVGGETATPKAAGKSGILR